MGRMIVYIAIEAQAFRFGSSALSYNGRSVVFECLLLISLERFQSTAHPVSFRSPIVEHAVSTEFRCQCSLEVCVIIQAISIDLTCQIQHHSADRSRHFYQTDLSRHTLEALGSVEQHKTDLAAFYACTTAGGFGRCRAIGV